MQNKDLRWVRPEYVFGSDNVEKSARTAKREATKSETFVDDGKQETFTVAQIASLLATLHGHDSTLVRRRSRCNRVGQQEPPR